MRRLAALALLLVTLPSLAAAQELRLPNKEGSVKFDVIGDSGQPGTGQTAVAQQLVAWRTKFPCEFILMTGDNLYGRESPKDYEKKFSKPYKALLDGGVKFYASLGNHDAREQSRYKLFNMDGKTYYSFKAPDEDVRFFALETDYLSPAQLSWLQKELESSNEKWKIPYFHHPLYSSGGRHGSHVEHRNTLEPLFLKYGVSVVFTGHDHFYERIKPQNGIVYFVVGSGGKLRRGDIDRRSPLTARGFDTDLAFLAAEISGDEMHFNTISRQGAIIDSGVIQRRKTD